MQVVLGMEASFELPAVLLLSCICHQEKGEGVEGRTLLQAILYPGCVVVDQLGNLHNHSTITAIPAANKPRP